MHRPQDVRNRWSFLAEEKTRLSEQIHLASFSISFYISPKEDQTAHIVQVPAWQVFRHPTMCQKLL